MSSDTSFKLGGSHCKFCEYNALDYSREKERGGGNSVTYKCADSWTNGDTLGAKSLSTIRARTPYMKNKSM